MGVDLGKLAEALANNLNKSANSGNIPISKKTQTVIDICGYGLGFGLSHCTNEVVGKLIEGIVPPGAKLGTKIIFKAGELTLKACLDGAIFVGTGKAADYVKAGIAVGNTVKFTIREMKEDGKNGEPVTVEFEDATSNE